MKTNHHVTTEIRTFGENGMTCDEPDAALRIQNGRLDVADKQAMEAELNELRYHLERNVEQRTEQLLRNITLLESCNATLCEKLASVQRELAVLKLARNSPDADQDDRFGKLYAMSDWTKSLIGTSVQDDWGGHATAA